MKKTGISRLEILRTGVALACAIAILGTTSIALPSLATAETEIPPVKGPQLEPETLAAIESLRETAAMIPEPVVETARITSAIAKPIATGGLRAAPSAAGFVRATAHEAIKMKKGIIPLIPAKFRRAEEGVTIPVSLTQYCVQGETRRGRQSRHGILAADPRIFPLARYVDVAAPMPMSAIHRELALQIKSDWKQNGRTVRRLREALQLALILLLFEILAWFISIAEAGGT